MDSVYFNEPVDEVLSHYDFEILNIQNECYKVKKGVWWIETEGGYKILKKVPNSEEDLKFILSAVNHLTANGVNIPLVNKTWDDKEYVNIDGTCYILLDAVVGKNPSYNSPEELMLVVKGLAKFHKASSGFSINQECKPDDHLGAWVEEYQDQIEDMKGFYEKVKSSEEKTAFDELVINEFSYFYEKAKESINNLNSKEYRGWVEKVKASGNLCHQDFAAGNLLINSKGLFVLDLDGISFDIPARDIRKLFNKIMKKTGNWNDTLAKEIIDYYQSENPLTKDEWLVVKYDLMFPHLFIGAMSKYYYKRDGDWTQNKYYERLKEMTNFEKTKIDLFCSYSFE